LFTGNPNVKIYWHSSCSFTVNQFFHGGRYLNSSKKMNGFTLIEVLVALIILAISLLALAGLMVTTTKNNSSGNHMTEAATFAQDKLEELRAMRWENLPVGTSSDQKSGSTGINYTRNWKVEPGGVLKTITISINWQDRTNHSIGLTSVLSQ
jgi:prepilin-type N-terminal cleavage/methylation domain-containing protein